ncbi:MAG: ABC transporter ATP-binding protein [Myxococcota bacterium]
MIELEKVSKRYGDFVAVNQVSLKVRAGELLVLLGGSGSGKTTTLKMINRLIEPTEGKIRLDGEDITDLPAHEVRRRIGYAFQKIGLFPHMTVAENIAITPKLLGWDQAKMDARVDELLEMVELDPREVRGRLPSELSGGQQQRIGVARALGARPKVMLLDEPFGALDPITRDAIQQFFLRIRQETGLTAIFVTHDMVEALILGDRIAVMHEGDLVQLGTPRELLTEPANDYVETLMSTPKNQADFVEQLIEGEPVRSGERLTHRSEDEDGDTIEDRLSEDEAAEKIA